MSESYALCLYCSSCTDRCFRSACESDVAQYTITIHYAVCVHRLSQAVPDMSIESPDATATTTSANAVTEHTAAVALNSSDASAGNAASHDTMSVVQPVVAGMAT
jgi:hypothetical protein